jgi:hypothetical protein
MVCAALRQHASITKLTIKGAHAHPADCPYCNPSPSPNVTLAASDSASATTPDTLSAMVPDLLAWAATAVASNTATSATATATVTDTTPPPPLTPAGATADSSAAPASPLNPTVHPILQMLTAWSGAQSDKATFAVAASSNANAAACLSTSARLAVLDLFSKPSSTVHLPQPVQLAELHFTHVCLAGPANASALGQLIGHVTVLALDPPRHSPYLLTRGTHAVCQALRGDHILPCMRSLPPPPPALHPIYAALGTIPLRPPLHYADPREPPLSRLEIPRQAISDAGARILAHVLMTNTTLHTLNLTDCGIGPVGASALATALSINGSVQTLNLSTNALLDAGVTLLAAALSYNRSITFLDVSCTHIGESGAVSIAACLQHNMAITSLDVSSNILSDGGARALAASLSVNDTLTALTMHRCFFGVDGKTALGRALETSGVIYEGPELPGDIHLLEIEDRRQARVERYALRGKGGG